MDWNWAIGGITDEVPRTAGPDCIEYMTTQRRIIEAIIVTILCLWVTHWSYKRMDPIEVPAGPPEPHSPMRLFLLILMCFIFGVEMGFKLAGESVIFVLNPCHIQTIIQIYLLAARPSKLTIALFRIQMSYVNGPFLASLFPEVESRTYAFEKCTYWIQHALLYLIPVYMLRSGAYKAEKLKDFYWVAIGVSIMFLYHFNFLTYISVLSGVNLSHMMCAAIADPFQGNNYRIAALFHESTLCPILNKLTIIMFNKPESDETSSSHVKKILQNKTQGVETIEHNILTTKID
ncbi:transmembrane protein 164 [Episyrphus balteatus]|uniref:transmembrane protein 164 n=1 Tax=Episyrphus balteatus TaxID=286459 RepID=UPI0024866F05|nr:transmembrane protein 164 [Episyrphus balteatus]XP_055854310.1 transmembrane protein 164 [Episyrphus balteatus]